MSKTQAVDPPKGNGLGQKKILPRHLSLILRYTRVVILPSDDLNSFSAFSIDLLEPLPAGLKFGYDLFPLLIAPHGNKGFGPVWGFALSNKMGGLFRCLASPFCWELLIF